MAALKRRLPTNVTTLLKIHMITSINMRILLASESAVKFWFVSFAVAYAAINIALVPSMPEMQPDSRSYLIFSPDRSLGYPVFLKAVGLQGVLIAQHLLYSVALALLCMTAHRLTRSVTVAGLLAIALVVNPELNKYHSVVMTESLFMTLLIAQLAAIVRFVRLSNVNSLVLAAFFGALAATVRPTGYVLLTLPLLIVLLTRQKLQNAGWAISAALIMMLVIAGGERVASAIYHRGAAESMFAHHIFAKAAMIEAPRRAIEEQDPLRRLLFAALEDEFAPVRNLIREAPSAAVREWLTGNYEICIEYACTDELRTRTTRSDFDRAAFRVGLERIASAPFNFVRLVWVHYRALWSLYSHNHPRLASSIHEFVAAHRPLPFEPLVAALTTDAPIRWYASLVRPAIMAIGIWTGAVAFLGLLLCRGGKAPGTLAIAIVAGFSIHASFFFTAFLGVGAPRYTVAMWPAMATCLVFSGWWLLEMIRSNGAAAAKRR